MTTCECNKHNKCNVATLEVANYLSLTNIEDKRRYMEYQQLSGLWYNLLWYNFEINALKWHYPWPQTFPTSKVRLKTTRTVPIGQHGAILTKHRDYYNGPVLDAVHVPHEILKRELDDAKREMEIAHENRNDAISWAPGGAKYTELLEQQTAFSDTQWISDDVLNNYGR